MTTVGFGSATDQRDAATLFVLKYPVQNVEQMTNQTTDQTIANLRHQLEHMSCSGCGAASLEKHRRNNQLSTKINRFDRHEWQPISITPAQLRQLLDRVDELTKEDAESPSL